MTPEQDREERAQPEVDEVDPFAAAESAGDDPLAGELKLAEKVSDQTSLIRELFAFLWQEKLWWMAPMMVILLLVGVVLVIATAVPGGSLIYTLF